MGIPRAGTDGSRADSRVHGGTGALSRAWSIRLPTPGNDGNRSSADTRKFPTVSELSTSAGTEWVTFSPASIRTLGSATGLIDRPICVNDLPGIQRYQRACEILRRQGESNFCGAAI